MADAFKLLINPATIQHASEHLHRAWPAFDRRRFEDLASTGLEALEFKARALQIADALEACLPAEFHSAAAVLERAMAPALNLDAQGEPIGLGQALSPDGLSGWALWGAGEWVTRRGMVDIPRAMDCLHALTQRFTAEYAIRPFIHQHPHAVFPTLARWALDPSAHVRRLVSEGSRPRLPWGLRLQALVQDPTPALPLLAALQDDGSAYVRRSVANHLNDIAKDHPNRVAQWVESHLQGASDNRRALLRHASRSLIKQGHVATLAAWGLTPGLTGQADFALSSLSIRIGERLGLQVGLQSESDQPQRLVIDYVVHHVRANGTTSPKVFKGWSLTLAPGGQVTLNKTHSLRPVSTRVLYPGLHCIKLQINGQAVAESSFQLST